jgi:hypothetical protein
MITHHTDAEFDRRLIERTTAIRIKTARSGSSA